MCQKGIKVEADIWQPASVKGTTMSSTSMISCNFSGMRVAGNLSYFPGYVKADGKHVDQRVIIPAYANYYSPNDAKKSDQFDFIVWGRMAETLCRNLSVGREFNVLNATPEPYESDQKHSNGQIVLDMVTGVPIKKEKTTYEVPPEMFKFSEHESAKLIAQQKQTGHRPMQWNNAAHPDSQTWAQLKVLRNSEVWNGESEKFGFAKVFMPKGAGVVVDQMKEKTARTARDVAQSTAPAPAPAVAPQLDVNMLALMIKEAVKADREAQQLMFPLSAQAAKASASPSPFNSDYTAMGEPKTLFNEILSQLPEDVPAPPAEDVNLF